MSDKPYFGLGFKDYFESLFLHFHWRTMHDFFFFQSGIRFELIKWRHIEFQLQLCILIEVWK